MVAYRHKDGCGEIAFYMKHLPVEGERRVARDATFPDGTPIKNGDEFRCGHCGQPILARLSYFD